MLFLQDFYIGALKDVVKMMVLRAWRRRRVGARAAGQIQGGTRQMPRRRLRSTGYFEAAKSIERNIILARPSPPVYD